MWVKLTSQDVTVNMWLAFELFENPFFRRDTIASGAIFQYQLETSKVEWAHLGANVFRYATGGNG